MSGPIISTEIAKVVFSANIDVFAQGTVTTTSGYGPNMLPSDAPNTLQLSGGGSSPNASSVVFGDGTGWLLNFGPVRNGSFSPRITLSDLGVIATTAGYGDTTGGGAAPPANSVEIGGGGASPNAGSIIFGDGTGWKLNLGPVRSGAFQSQFTFLDTGDLGIGTTNPSAALDVNGQIHSSGGIVFPDGSLQTKAQVVGPQGPAGPRGPQQGHQDRAARALSASQ